MSNDLRNFWTKELLTYTVVLGGVALLMRNRNTKKKAATGSQLSFTHRGFPVRVALAAGTNNWRWRVFKTSPAEAPLEQGVADDPEVAGEQARLWIDQTFPGGPGTVPTGA